MKKGKGQGYERMREIESKQSEAKHGETKRKGMSKIRFFIIPFHSILIIPI